MASNVLPLFWHLASASKETRLNASAELVGTLEGFQAEYTPVEGESDDEEESDAESGMEVDGDDEDEEAQEIEKKAGKLDKAMTKDNAEDVVYAVRRLIRGLASSREHSRLGFAVALTELLSRLETVTAAQVISLIMRGSQFNSGMKGSEERDNQFARLFGLTSLVQSQLLFASSATLVDFAAVINQLAGLGKSKAWLRESAWWSIAEAVKGLLQSQVEWKDSAIRGLSELIYSDNTEWTQEKVALTLILQSSNVNLDWKTILSPAFKQPQILASANLVALARILKETTADADDEGGASSSTGSWKPQLHFVWSLILDAYFNEDAKSALGEKAPFEELFRVTVDQSLFANTSSSERKYWGFQVFEKSLPLLSSTQMPLVFTPNFMRSWMNNLSGEDRYLHKVAVRIAKLVQDVVKSEPKVAFTLLSQLVGKNGRPDFDRVTKTKTVEAIMGSLSGEGVKEYVTYLQSLVTEKAEEAFDLARIESRRAWALDQMLALVRNGSIPKEDAWVSEVLDFLLVHGFFTISKANKKSKCSAVHTVPSPAISEATAAICRGRFFSSIVELSVQSTLVKDGEETRKLPGCDSKGHLWLSRCLKTVADLEADSKHASPVLEADEEIAAARADARKTIEALSKISTDVARGVEILLSFVLLQTYDENDGALDMLEEVQSCAADLFTLKPSSSKSSTSDDPPAIDMLLDVLVGLLDKQSNDLRALANVVFGLVSSAVTVTGIEHLIAQLEAAPGTSNEEEADEEAEASDVDDDDEDDEDQEEDDEESDVEIEDDDDNTEVDPEFRRKIAEALQVSGMGVDGEDDDAEDSDADSDEEDDDNWDDDQMLKVDEQLAEIFKQQAAASSGSKKSEQKQQRTESLHFKNRVLDMFDTFARRQPRNPLLIHTISPLLQLSSSTGTSESQLTAKASGVLRTRICKSKDVIELEDEEEAIKVLQDLHQRARGAATAELSSMCSQCSLFVSKALIHKASGPAEPVIAAYRATLRDFMTRKSSAVHAAFIVDFIKRFPQQAWHLRGDLVEFARWGTSVKDYRQAQAYQMLQTQASQLQSIRKTAAEGEVDSFTRDVREVIYDAVEKSTETSSTISVVNLKTILKYALQLARSSKAAGATAEQMANLWDLATLSALTSKFQSAERTKNFGAVQNLLHQLLVVVDPSFKAKKVKKEASKPNGEVKEAEDGSSKKRKAAAPKTAGVDGAKGKKVKKSKAKVVAEEEAEMEVD